MILSNEEVFINGINAKDSCFMDVSKRVLQGLLVSIASFPLSLYATENTVNLKQEIALLKNQLQNLEERVAYADQSINSTPVIATTPRKTKITQKSAKHNIVPSVVKPSIAPQPTQAVLPPVEKSTTPFLGNNALLTGYGTATYINPEHTHGSFDAKFNPIFLYRYNDLLLWESEVEFSLNSSGETETTLEFASLDWFINDYITLVAGKFLSPLGYFIRNLHPSWINPLPSKPIGFDDDQAAPPESEVGAQLLGAIPISDTMTLNYSIFIANGPQANVANGAVTDIQSDGMNSANKIYGGRIGFLPIPSLEVGVSGAKSRVAFQDSTDAIVETSRPYTVLGVDASYHREALGLRAEYIQQLVPDDANSTSGITQGGKWKAWYAQGSYRFLSSWEAILRYGYYSSPQVDQKQHQTTLGIDYWFMDSAVAKLAYEFNFGQRGTAANANRVLLQLAYGF